MAQGDNNPFRKAGLDTFYETYFQEKASRALLGRWQKIDVTTSILVASTATGSTVAGWTLWTLPTWKGVWIIAAGFAAVAAIVHGAMTVPSRVKDQEELRRGFSELRVDLETFLQQITINPSDADSAKRFETLRERYAQTISKAPPDIAYTKRLRLKVQGELNTELKERGYL